jgi:hypothetical protein
MRGTGIDSDVEIYAKKQSNEHQYMDLKGGGGYRNRASKIRTMDKVQNPSNSVCYTPSSEPYRIYFKIACFAQSCNCVWYIQKFDIQSNEFYSKVRLCKHVSKCLLEVGGTQYTVFCTIYLRQKQWV